MTALLGALARAFVAPRPAGESAAVAAAAAPCVAICGPAAEPLACALALLLVRHGPVVVCAWGGGSRRVEVPPTAAARRLARSLAARELAARASGRLVAVTLADDAAVAAGQIGRASAAAGGAPVVTALCAPRHDAFDALLAEQDAVVVAAASEPPALVRLATEALADAGARALTVPGLSAVAAAAAHAGLCAVPSARRALAAVVDVAGGPL